MPSWAEVLLAIAAGPVLWLAGAIFFDFVHWVLHAMLRSRWRPLRALAWPHAVHHQWIDRNLEVRWENQTRNVWCHIVPEYLTQLGFAAALLLLLPPAFVAVLVALQTAVFLALLRARGLDVNHRPIEMLDAYRPGFHTPPAYHALHHVYPDAYFSAYTKAVDWLVRGGAQLRGRRTALLGSAANAFARALRAELARLGVADVERWEALDESALATLDVLVLCDPDASPVPAVEAIVRATRTRKLPPEVWAVHARADDATARHYHRDVRVSYRTIVLRDAAALDARRARAAARIALSRIRRGFHFVPAGPGLRALAELRRFRRTAPQRPAGAPAVRRRLDLAGVKPAFPATAPLPAP